MCGILTILDINPARADLAALRGQALQPDHCCATADRTGAGSTRTTRAVLAHERLSIVDVEHGAQPLTDAAGQLVLAVNGEIYNHQELRASLGDYPFRTASDCEPIIPLYRRVRSAASSTA